MPQSKTRESGSPPRGLTLGYTAVLALIAGFVNAVALLILAFPVGNLTAVTTQLGMKTANPWLYEGYILVAILVGFLGGATLAGVLLAPTQALTGRRHAVLLILEAVLLVLAVVGVELRPIKDFIAATPIEPASVQAMLAAAALGLQNGLTSSIRGMSVRTTHFTGTVTDLGLLLGRSREHGIDKWKAAILSTTLLLFLAGGAIGLLFGARIGVHALLIPAASCVAVAVASVLYSRSYRDDQRDDAVESVPAN